MKYITLSVLVLACAFSSSVFANKKNKKQKDEKPAIALSQTPLTSESDTLSYAFGIYLSDNGLNDYLTQMGVLTDTTDISQKYQQRIEEATDKKQKEALTAELKAELNSINAENQDNLQQLLKGIREKLEKQESNDNKAYTKGLEIGDQLLNMSKRFESEALNETEETINNSALYEGIKNNLSKEPLRINNSKDIIENKMASIAEKAEQEQKRKSAETIAQGEKFMAENAKKEGVVTLPDGLQYKIIKEGNGSIPTASDKVEVHYKGTLIDGTVFDSSIDRGQPITFAVTQVIPGWTEVLQLMPVGSKWEVYIPYDLAYGSRDAGKIPPYSDLIFEIELLDIVK